MLVRLMSKLLIDGEIVLDNIEAIIFDKDGTLIDIHHYWSSMIKLRASLIAHKWFVQKKAEQIERDLVGIMGVDLLSGKIKPNGPVGIKPRPFIVNIASEMVRSRGVDITNNEMENVFLEVDRQTSEKILPLLKLLPGVIELLENLKKCGTIMIVASTDITSRARMAMEALKIDHFFSEIIGGDSVKNAKPSPDLALSAIEKCGIVADKIVVIGDHPVDVVMGKSANVGLNIGVLTGLSNATMFDNLDCTVINDLRSIEVRC
jgi:phosphoglycolate phosphatase